MSGRKDIEAVLDEARARGWTVERTARNHWKLLSPGGTTVIHTGGTPSDHRAPRNLRAQIARAQRAEATTPPVPSPVALAALTLPAEPAPTTEEAPVARTPDRKRKPEHEPVRGQYHVAYFRQRRQKWTVVKRNSGKQIGPPLLTRDEAELEVLRLDEQQDKVELKKVERAVSSMLNFQSPAVPAKAPAPSSPPEAERFPQAPVAVSDDENFRHALREVVRYGRHLGITHVSLDVRTGEMALTRVIVDRTTVKLEE